MRKKPYLPKGNAQKGIWLSNLRNKLTVALATKLGITIDEIAVLNDDTEVYNYGLLLAAAGKTFEHQCVSFHQSMKSPQQGIIPVTIPVFELNVIVPKAVTTGIFTRVSALVKKIKLSVHCTDDINKALGIIGAEPAAKSGQEDVMPVLSAKVVAGQVKIKYIKATNDGIKLECRRGTETEFTILDKINKPVYFDKRELLIAGQPEKRDYRACFFIGDKLVGQLSAVITITVAE
ncbi:MAG: hypothetical protein WCP65_05145 [Bacteroidota bacterium]